MRRAYGLISLWAALTTIASGCPASQPTVQHPVVAAAAPAKPTPPKATTRPQVALATSTSGEMTIDPETPVVEQTAGVTIHDLAPADTHALLASLEPLPKLTGPAPVMRPPTAMPPGSGTIAPIAFVVPTGNAVSDKPAARAPSIATTLDAPQILPIGEVRAESEIRVRFAEPMVALAKIGATDAQVATITPTVKGKWKWLDTRVAEFTADGARLPQATEFKVTVPAGTTAASGAVLAADQVGTFSTPPVEVLGIYPTPMAMRPDSPIALQLDQDVDPTALVKLIRVVDKAKHSVPIALTTLAAAQTLWAKYPRLVFDDKTLGPHYVLVAPTSGHWPSDARLDVLLAKDAPSREGPRLSKRESRREFTVVKPFKIAGIDCGLSRTPKLSLTCPEKSYANLEFTTNIDEPSFRAEMIKTNGPALRAMSDDHWVRGRELSFRVPAGRGKTTALTVSDEIRDIYGQSLVGAHQLSLTAGREDWAPYLQATHGMFILDPRFQIPQWIIDAQSTETLHVELYRVQPSDYFAWSQFEAGKKKSPPGTRVYQHDFTVGDRFMAEARVDLRPALANAQTGHVVAIATARAAHEVPRDYGYEPKLTAWIQVTTLGMSARVDQDKLHAWVEDVSPTNFLKARGNVTTSLSIEGRTDFKATAQSDSDGLATFELPLPLPPKPQLPNVEPPVQRSMILAADGADSVFAVLSAEPYQYPPISMTRSQRVENAEWYVTDDRFIYKPGEPVYMKGWVRWTHDGVNPGLEQPKPNEMVSYEITDGRNNAVATGMAKFTDQGGFDFQFDIPATAALGSMTIALKTRNQVEPYYHTISVQEFRTPAFAVKLDDDMQFSGATPLYLGEAISMNAEASYFAGGGLAGAKVEWNAVLSPSSYKPPGWDQYTFTQQHPRAYDRQHDIETTRGSALGGASSSVVSVGITALADKMPALLKVETTVTDVDRQQITAKSRSIIVHPASVYVGLRMAPSSFDSLLAVVTDVDGNVVPNVPIEISFEGSFYSERRKANAAVHETTHCSVTSSTQPVPCKFTPPKNHDIEYLAVATVHDSRGRVNTAQFEVPWWHPADVTKSLDITADREKYRAGDIAKLEIHSTIFPSDAVVSYARQGIFKQQHVRLEKAITPLEVPMDVGYLQNLFVEVERPQTQDLSNDTHKGGVLPEMTTAEIDLPIDLDASRLVMRANPTKPKVQPGEEATFDVEVKRDGKPVENAEVALIVVDEAVLALSGQHHADPLEPFYRAVEDGIQTLTTFTSITDADTQLDGSPGYDRFDLDKGESDGVGWGQGMGGGYGSIGHGAGGGGIGTASVITARKDFRATAVFSPHLHTDAKGHVSLTVKMPESLTRFRVVALASAQTYYFGVVEGTIVTQRRINARTQAPRFLSQGDRFELPVIVQNLDSVARTISVAARAANLEGGGGKVVTIPGGQRAEVRFPFATTQRGRAVIQTIVKSGDLTDASNVTVPVYEPATTETFATYGVVDDKPAYEKLAVPKDVFVDVGGVETELSSTQMQTLTDAYDYLQAYPYECAEERSSRMLGTLAMKDVLDAFGTAMPSAQEIKQIANADVAKLQADQNKDGGWGYWQDTESDEFVTTQVVTALAELAQHGAVIDNGKAYIAKLLAATNAKLAKAKRGDPMEYDVAIAARALTALAATGRDERAAALALHTRATELGTYPVDAKAQLLALVAKTGNRAMRAALVAQLLSAIHETAAGATVTTAYSEREKLLLVSDHRTTALAMDALIRESPTQPLIEKLARGLLAARSHGRWRSTQENLAVMRAMRRYFDVYEKATPNYTGKMWIGDVAYAEQAFVGRTNLRAQAALDWKQLAPGTQHDIALAKTGPGRMYYRIGITYAPKQVDLPALDAGFIVTRSYQALDDPHDVEVTPTGVRIKLGARVLVVLDALNTTRRDAVALVDPLPAGLEIVNTNLATTSSRAVAGTTTADWRHIEARDNRSEAFALSLREGTHRFAYTARATTPGTFIAAPAKAEEMYSPETFGRSTGTAVTIY